MKRKVLIVDDQKLTREFLIDAMSAEYSIDEAKDLAEARKKLEDNQYDLVLTDVRMNDKDEGIELLHFINKRGIGSIVVVMTGYASIEQATEAIRLGAYDYIEKPFTVDEIKIKLKKALEFSSLKKENRHLRKKLNISRGKEIIGASPKLKEILRTIDMIADTRATVLITGESGTGKEMIAKRIHNLSSRKDKPFVKINCAAIPEGTLESELFGHEKGSFTSAYRWHPGKFEQANQGTLLLDEIGEIPPHIQAKLLRVLQEREIDRVGGRKPIPVDVRIISTTNRNLIKEIREGRFREDLYFRLNVVNIEVPPLRERREDIPLLVDHFVEIYCEENSKPKKKLSAQALKKLQNGVWRGNIRELENCIERAVILCEDDVIGEEYFTFDESVLPHSSRIEEIFSSCTLAEAERFMIEERLKKFNDNRTKAAQDLGISVRTLRNKLKLYREMDLTGASSTSM